jgi:hypothetical protein
LLFTASENGAEIRFPATAVGILADRHLSTVAHGSLKVKQKYSVWNPPLISTRSILFNNSVKSSLDFIKHDANKMYATVEV